MATIKEVAKLAGVSVGTVSNVLNGKTSNDELIERVENAINQLSYRPDANARSLKNTKSKLIGVIMPEVCQSDHAHFLSSLENFLREKGYGLILKMAFGKEKSDAVYGTMCRWNNLVFTRQRAAYHSGREKRNSICDYYEISIIWVYRRSDPD